MSRGPGPWTNGHPDGSPDGGRFLSGRDGCGVRRSRFAGSIALGNRTRVPFGRWYRGRHGAGHASSSRCESTVTEPVSVSPAIAPNDFTHLHVHSEFSLLDGLGRINELVDSAIAHGFDSLAVT